MIGDEKIVDFHTFCPLCINHDLNESEEPCYSCLGEPANVDSRRPIKHEFSAEGQIIFDQMVAAQKRNTHSTD